MENSCDDKWIHLIKILKYEINEAGDELLEARVRLQENESFLTQIKRINPHLKDL